MRETTAAQIPLCPNLQQGQVRAAARAWGSGGVGAMGGGGGGYHWGGGGGVVAPDPRAYDAGLPHPSSPPHPMVSPPPPLWGGACGGAFPRPPVVSLLWWAVPLALFAVVPAAGGTAHDVVLQTATRVDNRIIFDIMLNIIIVVVIFIISNYHQRTAATITIAVQPS